MKMLMNEEAPTQRRIIIEVPQLVHLFDLLSTLIRHDRGDEDLMVPVNFDELVPELDSFMGLILDAVFDRVNMDTVTALLTSHKTGETELIEQAALRVIEKLIKEDKDGLMAILGGALKVTLAEAMKSIMDDVIREGGFNDFKHIKIKTRRHVVVLC